MSLALVGNRMGIFAPVHLNSCSFTEKDMVQWDGVKEDVWRGRVERSRLTQVLTKDDQLYIL